MRATTRDSSSGRQADPWATRLAGGGSAHSVMFQRELGALSHYLRPATRAPPSRLRHTAS